MLSEIVPIAFSATRRGFFQIALCPIRGDLCIHTRRCGEPARRIRVVAHVKVDAAVRGHQYPVVCDQAIAQSAQEEWENESPEEVTAPVVLNVLPALLCDRPTTRRIARMGLRDKMLGRMSVASPKTNPASPRCQWVLLLPEISVNPIRLRNTAPDVPSSMPS